MLILLSKRIVKSLLTLSFFNVLTEILSNFINCLFFIKFLTSILFFPSLTVNFLILNLLSFISKLVSKFNALLFELKFNNGISILPLKPPQMQIVFY